MAGCSTFVNSRCNVVTRHGNPSALAFRNTGASISTILTERCRPPVHPTAMVAYFFPSCTKRGRTNFNNDVMQLKKGLKSGSASMKAATSASRPVCGRNIGS